jgi:predicted metal-dependent peptidase
VYSAGGGTTDGIYHILPEDDGDGPGNGPGAGDSLDNCEDAEGSPAEQAQQAAEMKVRVAQAAQAAKMMGKLSANMQRLVDEALNPKVDWRDVLRRFLTKCKSDDRSFSRPNRRFLSQGLYLPTTTGETLGELLFAVDCSGSIQKDELNQFAAEVRCVKEDMHPAKIHVVYFDSEISHYESYGPEDELDIKPHGGGGTAFSPIFAYMQEHAIDPVAVVVLTDLYCNDYGDQPDCPVLWVSNTDHGDGHYSKPPFGEVVIM